MHIAILGAGKTGRFSAERLSSDGHSVVVVDKDAERLEEVQKRFDVATMQGSSADPVLLQELMEDSPDIVLAATDSDEVNLVSCAYVKQFANTKTIARIKEPRFFSTQKVDVSRLFHVDHVVIQELLVAEQIAGAIINGGQYSESYFYGNVLLRSITVSQGSPLCEKSLSEIRKLKKDMIVGLIHRPRRIIAEDITKHFHLLETHDDIIFPHGKDHIQAEDELLLIGHQETLEEANALFGIETEVPKSVLVYGASEAGIHLAKLLKSKNIAVRLVDTSKKRARRAVEELPDVSVIIQETENVDFLQSEHVEKADVFVAASGHDETNLLLGLLARDLGCSTVMVVLTDEVSCHLAEKQGITHVISPRTITIDRIAGLATDKKIHAVQTLYGGKAEILQVKVSIDSPLAGIPISVLGPKLPPSLLFAVIYNRGRVFIAGGTHILSPRDEVILIAHPKHRKLVEELL